MEKKILISIFSFAIFFLVTFFFFYLKNNADVRQKENVSIDTVEKSEKKFAEVSISDLGDVDCEEGWDKYVQNTIGISFCYPKYWGVPYTEPSQNITELDGIVDKYSENDDYYQSIYIRFSNIPRLEMKIFDEQYPGGHYPNARTYELGYMDNIPTLKHTGDICEYKIEFNKKWEEKGSMNEIYSSCSNDIKEYITENDQYFNFMGVGQKYSYKLNLASYKKLENDFFDNVLIIYSIDDISQIDSRITSLDSFFANENSHLSMEEFVVEENNFQVFVHSIRSFKPFVKELRDCAIIAEKDSGITLINKYYCHLSNEDLQKAFDMRSVDMTSYDEFVEWYDDINTAHPRDFSKKQDGSYEFFVDYQDYNGEIEIYRVIMFVQGQVLKTVFSEKYLSDVAKSVNGHIAYGARRGDRNVMILNIDGNETILDEGDAEYDENHSNIGSVKYFFRPEFSESERYLMYGMSGWEWSEVRVFDVKRMEQAFRFDSPNNIGFLQNDQYLYACSSSGMSSGVDGKVYSLPDFELLFDLIGDGENIYFTDVDCEYNKDEKNVIFRESHFYDPQKAYADDEKTVERIFHLE